MGPLANMTTTPEATVTGRPNVRCEDTPHKVALTHQQGRRDQAIPDDNPEEGPRLVKVGERLLANDKDEEEELRDKLDDQHPYRRAPVIWVDARGVRGCLQELEHTGYGRYDGLDHDDEQADQRQHAMLRVERANCAVCRSDATRRKILLERDRTKTDLEGEARCRGWST